MKTTTKHKFKAAYKVDNDALRKLDALFRDFHGQQPYSSFYFSVTHKNGETSRIESDADLELIPNSVARRVTRIWIDVAGVKLDLDSAFYSPNAANITITGEPDFVRKAIAQLESWFDRNSTSYSWAARNYDHVVLIVTMFASGALFWHYLEDFKSVTARMLGFYALFSCGMYFALLAIGPFVYPKVLFTLNGGEEYYTTPANRRRVLGFSLAIALLLGIFIVPWIRSLLHR
jgi:hypothetical protein